MPANYTLIEKITVGAAGASSVTFSGIPQTGYTDLVVKMSVRSDNAGNDDSVVFGLNGNAFNSSMTNRVLRGTGSSAVSASGSYSISGYTSGGTSTASTFGNFETYFPNYTGSNFKSVSSDGVSENNGTAAVAQLSANLWSSTAAITSITFSTGGGGNFVANSTFYLYGVAKLGTTPAIVPYATGGDTIMTDGTYWYHAFKSSGTFTPQKSLTCDYLVVAGGGGGQTSNANGLGMGGGGAGGLRSTVTVTGGGGSLESALSLAANTGYTVTIGAGGAGGTSNTVGGNATAGSNSVFSTITSTGGGRGGNQSGAATSGGSGGGDCGDPAGQSPGAGTTGQGYAGGNSGSGDGAGSGGGGAGAVGVSSGTGGASKAGAGGAGVQITALATITGTGVSSGYYAGGGGGSVNSDAGGTPTLGAGGIGGGGSGGIGTTAATSGIANTGGGGGAGGSSGSTFTTPAGSGGSGIVIIRYAV